MSRDKEDLKEAVREHLTTEKLYGPHIEKHLREISESKNLDFLQVCHAATIQAANGFQEVVQRIMQIQMDERNQKLQDTLPNTDNVETS